MKNNIIKSILVLLLIFVAMPMVAQDCMEIHLKDGSIHRFYLEGVKEITTSQYDADGQKHSGYDYQHITTNNDNYVFPLIEIAYVSFSKFYENIVKDDFYSAMSQTLPLLADCETVQDAEYKLNFINQAEGVEKAWTNGNCLYVKIKEWETISFHFSHNDNNDAYSSSSHIKSYVPKLKRISEQNNGNLSIVIANQMHNDMARSGQKNLLMALCNDLSNSGLNAHYEDKPSWDFFKTKMYDYDIVFLMTHGGYYNGLHSFITCDELGKVLKTDKDGISKSTSDYWFKIMNKYIEDTKGLGYAAINFAYVDELRPLPHWVGYLQMDERYFGNVWLGGSSEGTFRPNSIFFNGACHSMDGNGENWHSLADKLIDNHGLGLYFGYSNANYYSEKAGDAFFRSMYKGYSTNRAFSDLSESYKVESDKDGAVLRGWPEKGKGNLFLFPTVTKQIEQTTAQNAFNSSGYVEVEGNTTCIDPNANDAVKMGFQYSTNENFSPASSVVSSDVIKLSKPIDNGNGNVQFRAKLTGLQPGNTYFYRAYTYDGSNYNYGEPCSFKIETASVIPDPVGTETFTVNGVSFTMVGVEGGTFWMGADDNDSDAWDSERPRHQVTLSSFAIGETEVTQKLWEAVMGSNPSYYQNGNLTIYQMIKYNDYGYLPVEMVSWDDCQEFITKLNTLTGRTFRLPTEAEWEYAARGGNLTHGYKYAGTNDGLSGVAWYNNNSHNSSYQVGDKTPNELGLYDMSGNLWEWCQDWASGSYYSNSPAMDPCNTATASYRVCRGGGFASEAADCRVACRNGVEPDGRYKNLGLRLALSGGGSTEQTYTSCPDNHHPHLIDLGLPSGTKWACCNVGASKPEDYGGYFAWGETSPKSVYNEVSYSYFTGRDTDGDGWIDENFSVVNIGSDIAGTQYDAATANWGSPWVMPNKEQMEELKNSCSSEWTTENGVNGRRFTGPNGASIFLPAAGDRWRDDLYNAGSYGDYWSSSLYESGTSYAWYLYLYSGGVDTNIYYRTNGQSVRPVRKN